MKLRQVPFFLYWCVGNVQFWVNCIGHLGWLSRVSNFPRFHKNVNSLELWKYISENSSPKGSFWRNKRKSKFSLLSWDYRYLQAMALNSSSCFRQKEAICFENVMEFNLILNLIQSHKSLGSCIFLPASNQVIKLFVIIGL